jgi:hypothetical protein
MALHLLLVPHATCEHGELIELRQHVSQPGERPSAFSDQAARAGHVANAQIEVAHGDGAGHDHCDALAVRHQIPEVGASVAAASLVWITPMTGAGDHAEARPVPLLLLAPKSSPPAA